jgi:hypothetical protein
MTTARRNSTFALPSHPPTASKSHEVHIGDHIHGFDSSMFSARTEEVPVSLQKSKFTYSKDVIRATSGSAACKTSRIPFYTTVCIFFPASYVIFFAAALIPRSVLNPTNLEVLQGTHRSYSTSVINGRINLPWSTAVVVQSNTNERAPRSTGQAVHHRKADIKALYSTPLALKCGTISVRIIFGHTEWTIREQLPMSFQRGYK